MITFRPIAHLTGHDSPHYPGPVYTTTYDGVCRLAQRLADWADVVHAEIPTKLIVSVSQLDGTFVSEFEGSEDEMKPVFLTAYYFVKFHASFCGEDNPITPCLLSAMELLRKHPGVVSHEMAVPSYIELDCESPELLNHIAKLATLLGLGLTREGDIIAGMELSLQSIRFAFINRDLFPKRSFQEVVDRQQSGRR